MTGVISRRHEPAEKVPTNPFAVPGLMRDVDPLNPVRNDGHLSLYVPVDNTETAFARCREEFRDASYLVDTGRLVVVTGDRGCGKTALINRCAYWLREQLSTVGLRGEIVDVTRQARENEPMAERRAKVCRALVDTVFQRQLFTSELAHQMREQPDDAYFNLASCLPTDLVLIVLLPRSADLTEELVTYATDARAQIVFFGETSYQLPDERRQRLDHAGHAPPVYLEVGGLREHDAARFAEQRLGAVPDGELPRVDPKALDDYTTFRRHVSIGEVQRLLYGMYEKLRVQADRPDEVTYQHISQHFLSIAVSLLENPR
ncbi:hypothetical protein [Micromonospora sagamiensis]|uniref:AAA ATPase-like protein n=1 Tax=Micromonospora sagamiensis TaxID=47875 RepID=A0A562WLM0_9ACTN|nr:hypothetical protein [Micromonospora sagamiensis]TWJ31190.1 hypothetical protein JD81_04744 [Micromonospora sagamiensis]BCL15765.1 hypothetical protein GCM10017556_35040 [Micromonospora sagamiensis]